MDNQRNLAPADQEVMLRPEKGDLSEDSASEITGESNQYQDSDMVTVIVELEDAPPCGGCSHRCEELCGLHPGCGPGQELRSTQDAIKAEIRSWSGAVSTQSVNGASDLEYSYTTVLNGFSMKMPYGDIARARELDGVKRIFVAEQYSLPTTLGEDEYTISMTSSTGMVGANEANELGYDGTGTIGGHPGHRL